MLQQIKNNLKQKQIDQEYAEEVQLYLEGAEPSSRLFEILFEYYCFSGEMPYGVAKARTGDPYIWIQERLLDEIRGELN